jgi:hypothetical protein
MVVTRTQLYVYIIRNLPLLLRGKFSHIQELFIYGKFEEI